MGDVYCKFCGGKAYVVSNSSKENYYRCPICGASRPCTSKGYIIGKYPWRSIKQLEWAERAHLLMDELCSTREETAELYIKLAKAIKIPLNKCHFRTMSISQMIKAYEVLKKWVKDKRDGKGEYSKS